jgi:deoxyribodipyrimidine photolyase
MVKGLKEVDASLREKRIPLHLVRGEPGETVPQLAQQLKALAGQSDRGLEVFAIMR